LTALAAGVAGFFLLSPPLSLSDDLAAAHTGAMMRKQEISVVSTDHHTVKPWFAGHIAVSPPVADFKTEGFALAGGRVQEVDGISMAVVVYRHGAHHVDLFVWAGAPVHAGLSVRQGNLALLWRRGDLNFAAVSDMDSANFKNSRPWFSPSGNKPIASMVYVLDLGRCDHGNEDHAGVTP